MKKKLLNLGLALVATWATSSKAEIVGIGQVNGRRVYVDVVHNGASQTIVLRRYPNMCSVNDIVVTDVAAARTTLGNASRLICTAKRWYDNGRTVAGCTATAVTVGCATAVVATDGAAAAYCGAALRVSVPYTLRTGVKDCVLGLKDKIAESIIGDRYYAAYGLGVGLNSGQWKETTSKALDLMCSYIK